MFVVQWNSSGDMRTASALATELAISRPLPVENDQFMIESQ